MMARGTSCAGASPLRRPSLSRLRSRAGPAAAHPLGNFTVNQYTRLDVAQAGVSVRYVLDMAEIPTFQPGRSSTRTATAGSWRGSARASATASSAARAAASLLTADGTPVRLALASAAAFPPGQGGLTTTRLDRASAPPASRSAPRRARCGSRNTYATDRVGWRELLVARGDGRRGALDRRRDRVDRTKALTAYPNDLLHSPPDVRSATTWPRSAPAASPCRRPAPTRRAGRGLAAGEGRRRLRLADRARRRR